MINFKNFNFNTPIIKYMPEYDPTPEIKAITYGGMNIGDKKTKVFAYIGIPDSENNKKLPAMVLVHGGGGHAYHKWVKMWNDRGYAAIAMDTTGFYPTIKGAGAEEGDTNNWIHGINGNPDFYEDDYTDAPTNDHLSGSDRDIDMQWMYHAVADTILANSILRADERIDSAKIGIIGISWGGVITAITIGYDNRFAFAIPIYGAGYCSESTGIIAPHFQSDMTKKLWLAEHNFNRVDIPVLWFNWNADKHFSMNITTKSYNDTVKNNPLTIIILKENMNHSHHWGWIAPESYVYADSIINGIFDFPRFKNQPCGRDIDCDVILPDNTDFTARIVCGDKSIPVEIKNGTIKYTLDDTVTGYYVELKSGEIMSTTGYTMLAGNAALT